MPAEPADPRNHIIKALPPSERFEIDRQLERVEYRRGQILLEPGAEIPWMVFPEQCVVSLLQEYESGDVVETVTVGCEGFVCVAAALDASQLARSRHRVQIGGPALRMARADFDDALHTFTGFRRLVLRYAASLVRTALLSVACNRVHTVDKRLARWLLMTRDRSASDVLPLTHDVLAQMLGVHRPTVSLAARVLERAGLISYARGRVAILDRAGLEAASCECYKIAERTPFEPS